jgi:hypothetical protein
LPLERSSAEFPSFVMRGVTGAGASHWGRPTLMLVASTTHKPFSSHFGAFKASFLIPEGTGLGFFLKQ